MIIFDIGTCVGAFTDRCFIQYDVEKIYAFEPLRVNFEFLKGKYDGNPTVNLVNAAVSNYNGASTFYKKSYGQGRGCDWVGNAGSSLIKEKNNVEKEICETVDVISLSSFIKGKGIEKIDILKVDAEGSEYDIFDDLIANDMFEMVDLIYYEDHSRKIKGLEERRSKFIDKAFEMGVQEKIWLQHNGDAAAEYSCPLGRIIS